MKLKAIKQEVYYLTCTKNTQQLKKERADLTAGKDLRYKVQWLAIVEQIKLLREKSLDISLKDLEKSEQMLKESLFIFGRMAAYSIRNKIFRYSYRGIIVSLVPITNLKNLPKICGIYKVLDDNNNVLYIG